MTTHDDRPHRQHDRLVPFAWLALSAAWAGVVLVTERPAWPLAIWIAITVGPLTALDGRRRNAG